MSEILAEGASARLESEYWHRQDDIAQIDGRDTFPDGDDYGIFDRLVNWRFNPDEHFRRGADDLAWLGWAAYVGYASPPSSIIRNPSLYLTSNAVQARWFRYRAASVGAHIYLRTRASVSFQAHAGIMIDDGVDAGDGQGANNFVRWMVRSQGAAVSWTFRAEWRIGGGAVTTTDLLTISPTRFYGLFLGTYGTRWTNWGSGHFIFGEPTVDHLVAWNGAAGWAWTPARVGIYGESLAINADKVSLWDWYDES